MTKEEWAALGRELGSVFGRAELLIDGYTVNFEVQQHQMRLVIAVFVNGWMKGEWLTKKTEECTRFCRPVSVGLYSPKMKKSIAAAKFSKRAIKTHFPDIDKRGTYYLPDWRSVASMKRHLIANNTLISVVRIGLTSPVTEGAAA